MKRVTSTDFRRHLARHLQAVGRGVELEITKRGRPIARLVPAGSRIQPAKRPFSTIRGRRFRPANWPSDSLTLLLEDRRRR